MITAANRAFMQRIQEQSMDHTCRIEPYVVGEDGTISYGTAFETICGFSIESGTAASGSVFDTVQIDAKLRLPAGTYIGMKDRVTILTAYGDPVEELTFEVVRLPSGFGPSAVVAWLQEVYS